MAKVRANGRWGVPGSGGSIAVGWKVHTYISGTSTNKATYTSSDESSANTNPVILDARGEAVIYWSGAYKVVVKDADDITVWSEDGYGEGESQVQIGEFNLLKNGSFESTAVTSGEPDNITIVDYSTGSHEIDDSDQYHGLNSLKFTSVGDGGGYATFDYFEVQGDKEIFTTWAMRSSVATVRNVVDIIWYTAAKTAISTTNIYDDSTTNPTSWTEKTGSGVAPSTARYAQVRLYGCHSSDATSGSTWFDDCKGIAHITAAFSGSLTGDLTGDVTGNVTGNVTGDLTGNVTGDVAGNVAGNVTGNVTGNADTATLATLATTATKHGTLNVKIIDIGDWDMTATLVVNIAHGLTLDKIRGISATVRNDASSTFYDFSTSDASTNSYMSTNITNVSMKRTPTGLFDTTEFDATSFNRGWITIQYVD